MMGTEIKGVLVSHGDESFPVGGDPYVGGQFQQTGYAIFVE